MEKPKCTRVVVMVAYSDGSSVMIDVKDPADFNLEEVSTYDTKRIPLSSGYKLDDSKLEYRVRISPDSPALISTYPIPEE